MKKLVVTLLVAFIGLILPAQVRAEEERPFWQVSVYRYCKPGIPPLRVSVVSSRTSHLIWGFACVPLEGEKVINLFCDMVDEVCEMKYNEDVSPARLEEIMLRVVNGVEKT